MPQIRPAISLELLSRIRTRNKRKGKGYDSKHYSTSPRPSSDARKSLQGVSRSGRDGQMASAERIHRQGASDGCESWRQLQNIVHEFYVGEESFLRGHVRRIDSART